MATLDGQAAIAWFRRTARNVPGMCLNTVYQAYGSVPSIGPNAGQYPDAMSGWNHATRRHPGDLTPPPGVPVYWGISPTRTDANARAGDVMISLGGGRVIGTDVLGAGRTGETTIAARSAAIARPYLGWTEDFLGHDVAFTSAASLDSHPINGPLKRPVRSTSMLFFEYDGVLPQGQRSVIAVDPAQGTYRYPEPWEVAAIRNEVSAGRALINPLGPEEWSNTFERLREIKIVA